MFRLLFIYFLLYSNEHISYLSNLLNKLSPLSNCFLPAVLLRFFLQYHFYYFACSSLVSRKFFCPVPPRLFVVLILLSSHSLVSASSFYAPVISFIMNPAARKLSLSLRRGPVLLSLVWLCFSPRLKINWRASSLLFLL